MNDRHATRRRFHPVYCLAGLPYLAYLWVPFYDRITPRLLGLPFFYWWQMAWILLAALLLIPIYLFEERRRKAGSGK